MALSVVAGRALGALGNTRDDLTLIAIGRNLVVSALDLADSAGMLPYSLVVRGDTVEAKAYRQTTASSILSDLMEATSSTLSRRVTDDVRAAYFQAWHRSRSRASTSLATLAQEIGLSWRVMRGGEVWIGVPEWPEIDLALYGEILDGGDGWAVYAPYDAPLFEPETAVGGRYIDAVVTTLDSSSLRQTVYYRRAETVGTLDRLRAGLAAFIDVLLGRSPASVARWDHLALYPATVSKQAADGRGLSGVKVPIMIRSSSSGFTPASSSACREAFSAIEETVSSGAAILRSLIPVRSIIH